MDKKQFRQRQIERLRQLSPDVKARLEEQIMERFSEQTAVSIAKRSNCVKSKIWLNTAPLSDACKNKISVLSQTFENRRMEFVSLTSQTQRWHPRPLAFRARGRGSVHPQLLDLIVVPG